MNKDVQIIVTGSLKYGGNWQKPGTLLPVSADEADEAVKVCEVARFPTPEELQTFEKLNEVKEVSAKQISDNNKSKSTPPENDNDGESGSIENPVSTEKDNKEQEFPEGEPNTKWKLKQLKAYLKKEKIEFDENIKTKEPLLELINNKG